jgi:hypothetical protein
MKKIILLCSSAILSTFYVAAPAQAQDLFQSQWRAQAHCPNDTVVWLNTRTRIYHFQGERWYGRTRNGAYVCEHEADEAGDRATENGQ